MTGLERIRLYVRGLQDEQSIRTDGEDWRRSVWRTESYEPASTNSANIPPFELEVKAWILIRHL